MTRHLFALLLFASLAAPPALAEEASTPTEPVAIEQAAPAESEAAATETEQPAVEAAPEPPKDETATDEVTADEVTADEATADETTADEATADEAGEAEIPKDETPEQKGLRLARDADERGKNFQWSSATGRMILFAADGKSSERHFITKAVEHNDGDRGMLVFTFPPDIAKTALLTVANKIEDDDQWLYLPALKRVKRISASGKTGSFVGSEFSFEDLGAPAVEDYSHVWLREEPCPGMTELTCNVIERRPLDEDSGYTRIVSWVDVEELRPLYSEFYDRKNALLKTLTITDYELYKDRFWRAKHLEMSNVVNGKRTEMLWDDFDFDTPLALDDFSTRALERLQ